MHYALKLMLQPLLLLPSIKSEMDSYSRSGFCFEWRDEFDHIKLHNNFKIILKGNRYNEFVDVLYRRKYWQRGAKPKTAPLL